MKKILFNVFSVLLIAAIFYFMGREFLQNWDQIRTFDLNFDYSALIFASFLYAAAFFVLTIGWYLLLKYFHHPIPFIKALIYFLITQPAKYIPGKVWIAVARMKFCKPYNIPHSITLLTTGVEGVFEILGGTYIALFALFYYPVLGEFSAWKFIALSCIGIFLLFPPVFYFLINIYLRIVKREPMQKLQRMSFFKLLFLQIVYIIGMLLLNLASAIFLQSFAPVDVSQIPLLVSIGALTTTVSILAVFVPAGLGVREGVWYLALLPLTAKNVAMIFALLSRLWMIILEALFAAIGLAAVAIRRRKTML